MKNLIYLHDDMLNGVCGGTALSFGGSVYLGNLLNHLAGLFGGSGTGSGTTPTVTKGAAGVAAGAATGKIAAVKSGPGPAPNSLGKFVYLLHNLIV